MYYLVYKLTNQINGKFYIGVHRTTDKDDGYMGSGILIKRAIEKYGLVNFSKEILFECSTPEEMFNKEREMVVVDSLVSYNLCAGGDGGNFDGGELHREIACKASQKAVDTKRMLMKDPSWCSWYSERISEAQKRRYKSGRKGTFTGKKHTRATKKKIGKVTSKRQSGTGNSHYGKMWIYNTETHESVRILKTEEIPLGWKVGRKMNRLKIVV